MPVKILRRILTVSSSFSFLTLSVPAQETKRNPEDQPRKIKRELRKAYVEWIEDVDLLKNGKELSKQLEDWREINDTGQRLTLARLLDSRMLEPGQYQIQLRIRDHVTGQTITPEATFTILP